MGQLKGGQSELAPLHARGRSRWRGPRATGDMANGAASNDPSYGLTITQLMRASYSHAENKCASPYIGERFGENGVGGKWLIGGLLRIPLTLLSHGNGAVEG
jgi:hypothetical protein